MTCLCQASTNTPRTRVTSVVLLMVAVVIAKPSNAIAFECPPGFLQLGFLGCIQEDQEGSSVDDVNWITAGESCLQNYGGRLPTPQEHLLAERNLSLLTDELGQEEWTNAHIGSTGAALFNVVNIGPQEVAPSPSLSITYRFRCFIPGGLEASPSVSGISSVVTIGLLGALLAGTGVWEKRQSRRSKDQDSFA